MAESTVVACPNCGKKYKISADKLGRTFKCTGCEARFQAGAEPEPTPPPVEEPVQQSYGEESSSEESAAPPATVDYNTGGAAPKTSGLAIASLICGIVGCIPGAQLAAVILGFLSLKKINRGLARGKALALIGIILGMIGIGGYIYAGYAFYKGIGIVKQAMNEVPHVMTTQAGLAELNAALKSFEIDNGRYPTAAEGLQALVTKPDGDLPNWKHAYVEKLPLDGWNHPFVYSYPGTNGKDYDLYSLGGLDGKRIESSDASGLRLPASNP